MNGTAPLEKLTALGLPARLDGQRLIVKPGHRLTTEARRLIEANREGIIAALRQPSAMDAFTRALAAETAPGVAKPRPVGKRAPADRHDAQRVPVDRLTDPANAISAFRERLAICTADGIPESEAVAAARAETGSRLLQLAQKAATYWRARLLILPTRRALSCLASSISASHSRKIRCASRRPGSAGASARRSAWTLPSAIPAVSDIFGTAFWPPPT